MVTMGMVMVGVGVVVVVGAVRTVSMMSLSETLARHALQQHRSSRNLYYCTLLWFMSRASSRWTMTVMMGMVVVVVVVGMVAVRTESMMGPFEALARHALQHPGSCCNICIRIKLACILSVAMRLVRPAYSREGIMFLHRRMKPVNSDRPWGLNGGQRQFDSSRIMFLQTKPVHTTCIIRNICVHILFVCTRLCAHHTRMPLTSLHARYDSL